VFASASRMPDIFDDATEISGAGVDDWLQATRSDCNRRGSKCFEQPAFVAFKYEVAPDQKEAFEKAWLKLKDDMKEEKGIETYGLVKTALDNVYYMSFNEWEDMYAFADHMDKDYVRDFRDCMRDNGIVWRMWMLKKVTKRETRYELDENRRHKSTEGVRFLVKYIVPPEVHEEFLDTWEDAQKDVDREKGIRTFTLHKVASDNVMFIGCYTWESYEDFKDHIKSDHGCRLRSKLDKHRVIYNMVPTELVTGNI